MYIFPKIPIIPRIEELAEKENKEYDFIWCRIPIKNWSMRNSGFWFLEKVDISE